MGYCGLPEEGTEEGASRESGPWQTVYNRFCKWKETGVFEAIFQALSAEADFEIISINSTSCKVYQSANGGEKLRKKLLECREAAEI